MPSATPRRSLRPRAMTPLPAVATRASNAYGAQGKASLHTQVTTTAVDFDNAFETAVPRRKVPPRKSRLNSMRASSPVSEHIDDTAKRAASDEVVVTTPQIDVDHNEESDLSDERPGTAIQTSALYGARQFPPSIDECIRERDEDGLVYEASRLQVFIRTLPRYLPRLLQDANSRSKHLSFASLLRLLLVLGAVGLTYGLLAHTSLPHHLIDGRDALLRGAHRFASPANQPSTDASVPTWYSNLFDRISTRSLRHPNTTIEQHQMNVKLLSRIQKLEDRVIELVGQISLHTETLKTLQDILPASVAVRKVDDRWDLEPHFWDALAERLSHGESAPLWQGFLRANEERLSALARGMTGETLDQALQDGRVLSADAFSQLVDENFQWLRTQYQEDFKSMQTSHLDLIRSIANETAIDAFNRSPLSNYAKSQLETLVKANQIHNAFEALRTPNFFSVGMGATVDPRLTSPTMQRPPRTFLQWLYVHISPVQYDKNPPIAALQRWEEATECWCAAPSRDARGKAQLTVMMPVEIYPDMLIVEHVPATATLQIAAAPRELEVWAELASPKRAQQAMADMAEHVPFFQERVSQCGKPPGPSFVCIGKARYEIHSPKHVQSFKLWPDAPQLNLLTKRVTVRVTENWGEQWTCIYRLRMTGTPPRKEPVESPDQPTTS